VRAGVIFLVGTPPPAYSVVESDASGEAVELAGVPVACLDVLGRSILHRVAGQFALAGASDFVMLADSAALSAPSLGSESEWRIERHQIDRNVDLPSALQRVIASLFSRGLEFIFLVWLGHYVEFNPDEVLEFAQERRADLVRLHDRIGPLGIWLLNGENAKAQALKEFRLGTERTAQAFQVEGYVNRLSGIRDLRRLVKDMFAGSCGARPGGREIKPGVWVDEGAHVHKQARVLPPAYVGKSTKIAAATLITRGSSVERDCTVNCGTVIEDSSVLAGTYIGTGLDVAHSVICGKTLIHLQRDLELEIYDEMLIAENSRSRLRKTFRKPGLELVKDLATGTKFSNLKGAL
jgi:hypothetical protein